MEHVRITPEGLFRVRWNSEVRKFRKSRVKRDRVFTALRDPCKIAKGTTLGDIFKMVASYPTLQDFIGQYSWCRDIEAFHYQAKMPAQRDTEVSSLVVRRCAIEHDDFGANFEFYGLGLQLDSDNKPIPDSEHTQTYSMSMTPMNEMAHLPIKIDRKVEVYKSFKYKKGQPYKLPEKMLEAKSYMTLLEVLDAIYWDISFYGGPQETAEFKQCMMNNIEAYERGEVKTISMDELKENLGLEQERPTSIVGAICSSDAFPENLAAAQEHFAQNQRTLDGIFEKLED